MTGLALRDLNEFGMPSISPMREMGAYEALWLEEGTTFKRLADRFRADKSGLPSDYVSRSIAMNSPRPFRT